MVEHVENIGEQARRVENICQSAARAELRDTHVKLQDTHVKLQDAYGEIREMRQEYQKSQADIQKLLQIAQGRKHPLVSASGWDVLAQMVKLEVKRLT